MMRTASGSFVEDIVIPGPLLASTSIRRNRNPRSPVELPTEYGSGKWANDIHVQKKRQYASPSQETERVSRTDRPRQTNHLLAVERMRTHLPPLREELDKSETSTTSQSLRRFSSQSDSSIPSDDEAERLASIVPVSVRQTTSGFVERARNSSLHDVYEKAKLRGMKLQRERWAQRLFEYTVYAMLVGFVYLVLIGVPLWKGAVYWLYHAMEHPIVVQGGWAIPIGMATIYAFAPLLILFEKDAPNLDYYSARNLKLNAPNTALLIPCFKSASIIRSTLEAALKVFPASHIFVIANGDSPTPIDATEEVCRPYGVNHIWSPIASKIIAQFVGSYAAKDFRHVLLIDDDCLLPPNFPIVVSRLTDQVRCIGYTLKSVGAQSSRGTFCQQAQDLEYKISGLQRTFAGKIGSATFPHGAISLWDREFLKRTFREHPGFSISEDWFLGHSCRRLGGRIKMCSGVFVETKTPSSIFFAGEGQRGGFGEMTIFKQRFLRWNFFFANGLWYNLAYIVGSWKLGWWETGVKVFVFQEIFETVSYLLTPFILPIGLIVRPGFCVALFAASVGLYLINVIIFNELHLRLKNERIRWKVLLWYYMPYKILLGLINVTSCYWSLFKYAKYFAQRHPKVVEDEKAVETVLKLEETTAESGLGRRMTVTKVGAGSKMGNISRSR